MKKLIYLVFLFFYFVFQIIVAGSLLCVEILKGSRGSNGTILRYTVNLNKPWQLVLLFNLMSMTPGTLSIDITDNNTVLEMHLLNKNKEEKTRAMISKIEKLLMEAI